MLDHLDSLLTFSPNLGVGAAAAGNGTTGQFDDAEDEEGVSKEEGEHVTGNGHAVHASSVTGEGQVTGEDGEGEAAGVQQMDDQPQ